MYKIQVAHLKYTICIFQLYFNKARKKETPHKGPHIIGFHLCSKQAIYRDRKVD